MLNLQVQVEDQCMEVTPEIPMTPHTTSLNNAQAKDLSRDHSRGAVYLKKLPQAPNPGLFESGVCSSLTLKHVHEKKGGKFSK